MIKYRDISKKQVTDTAIVFAIVSAFIGVYYKTPVCQYISVILLFTVLIFPFFIKPLAFIWWNFSVVLSWLMSRIILTLLFIFIVTPVAMVRRAMGKDSLRLKAFKKDDCSVYSIRNHVFTDSDLKYPF